MRMTRLMIHRWMPVADSRAEGLRAFPFERLEVYQRALQFAGRIYEVAETLSPSTSCVTADHLRRTALAILRIGDGMGDRGYGSSDALQEAQAAVARCVPLLQLFAERGEIDADLYSWCYEECLALSEMIDQLIAQTEPCGGLRTVSR